MARKTVEAAGGFPEELARIDGVRATHGDNHVPLVARHFRKDRASMLAMVGVLDLEATSADRSVLQLLDYMREHTMLTRDYIPDRIPLFDGNGRPVLDPVTGEQQVRIFGTSFASENWNKAIRDRARPGMFVRRHLEACVLTYLAAPRGALLYSRLSREEFGGYSRVRWLTQDPKGEGNNSMVRREALHRIPCATGRN